MNRWLRADFGREAEARIMGSRFVRDGVFRPEYVRRLFAEHRAGAERSMLIWVLFNLVVWHDYWIR